MVVFDDEERKKDLEYAIDTGIIPKEYRGDKKFVLEVLEYNTFINSDLDENLKNDKEVVFELAKKYLGFSMDIFEFNIGEQLKNDNKYMSILSNLFSESKRLFNISISKSENEILSEYENLINNLISIVSNQDNEIDEYMLKSNIEIIKYFESCFTPSKIHIEFRKIEEKLLKDSGFKIDENWKIVNINNKHNEKAQKLDESVAENKRLIEELQKLQKQNQKYT